MQEATAGRPRRGLTVGAGAGACFAATAFLVGLRPLADNSFLTHLATGRLILERGSVPDSDPYTFTALGEPWVVQSWLASWLYATVEAVAGLGGLRILMGVTAAAVAGVAWSLSRAMPVVLVRFGLCAMLLVASASLWAERPLMLGLLAFGVVMLAGDGRVNPVVLLPIGWIWVNVHGSFPLGLGYLVVAAVGSHLDGQPSRHEVTALAWLGAGVLLGAVGPLGPGVLTFPLDLLRQQDVLANVIEWQPPTFRDLGQRAFLLQLLVAILLLVRRPRYRSAALLVVFGGLALMGIRNIPVASLVLIPSMAAALPERGSLRSDARGPVGAGLVGLAVVLVVLGGAARLDRADLDLRRYPVDALAFIERQEVDLSSVRLAAPDIVGNFREVTYGPVGDVFYDDRFDMFPSEVTSDHLVIVQGGPRVRAVLDRYDVDLVLWKRGSGAAPELIADPAWRVLYSDERWLVTCRRGEPLGATPGGC